MTKTIKMTLVPALLVASIVFTAAQAHAAPLHSLTPSLSKLQNAPQTSKSSSYHSLFMNSPKVSQLALSQDSSGKKPDQLAIHTTSGFTFPPVKRLDFARKFKRLASRLSKNDTRSLSSKQNNKSLLVSNSSRFPALKSELLMATPEAKTQPRL